MKEDQPLPQELDAPPAEAKLEDIIRDPPQNPVQEPIPVPIKEPMPAIVYEQAPVPEIVPM
jgi:hypothetical protein